MTHIEPTARKNPGIKRPYWGVPNDLAPEQFRCITLQIPDDQDYVDLMRSALESLALWYNYQRTGDTSGKQAADLWRGILDSADWAEKSCAPDQPEEGEGCIELGAFHPALSYFPNHPILTPGHEGGYVKPVWTTGAGYVGATGDDAMLDISAFLGQNIADLISGGLLPHIQLAFTGSGEIDFGLIGQIQGGTVVAYPDGNILQGDIISLQHIDVQELLSSDAILDFLELVLQGDYEIFEVVHTMVFETGGPHTVDLLFIPNVEPAPPFAGVGGGLRYVQLCGNIEIDTEITMPYTLEASGDGSIVLKLDDTPVSTVDLRALLDDDYVNVEGDTMTGTLINDQPSGATRNSTIHRIDGGDIMAFLSNIGGYEMRPRAPNAPLTIRTDQSSWYFTRWLSTQFLFKQNSGYSEAGVGDAYFRFIAGNNAGMAIKLQNSGGRSILDLVDHAGRLVGEVARQGWLRATNDFYMHGFSSTGTWREMGRLRSEFVVSTDATYLSRIRAEVIGYGGAQELWRGESHPDGERLAFRGADAISKPVIAEPDDSALLGLIAAGLHEYGLFDIDLQANGEGPPPIVPDFITNRCAAAWYTALRTVNLVLRIIDDLQTYTWDEAVTGLLDDFDVRVHYFIQALANLELNDASWADIETDIAGGYDDLAEQIYLANFDRSVVADWLADYLGWTSATRTAIIEVLNSILPLEWNSWIAIGQQIEDGGDCFDDIPCEELGTHNLRFGPLPFSIEVGTLTIPQGIVSADDGVNLYALIHVVSPGCDKLKITVEWWAEDNANADVIIRAQDADGGGWSTEEFQILNGVAGENTVTSNFGGVATWDRLQVQTQAQATGFGLESIIRSVKIEEL